MKLFECKNCGEQVAPGGTSVQKEEGTRLSVRYSAQFRMAERYGLVAETGTMGKFYFVKDQE